MDPRWELTKGERGLPPGYANRTRCLEPTFSKSPSRVGEEALFAKPRCRRSSISFRGICLNSKSTSESLSTPLRFLSFDRNSANPARIELLGGVDSKQGSTGAWEVTYLAKLLDRPIPCTSNPMLANDAASRIFRPSNRNAGRCMFW